MRGAVFVTAGCLLAAAALAAAPRAQVRRALLEISGPERRALKYPSGEPSANCPADRKTSLRRGPGRSSRAVAAPRTASLTILVRHRFGGAALQLNASGLVTPAGDRLSISRLAYLISDVELVRPDASRVALSGGPFYLNPGEGRTAFTLIGARPGRYRNLQFRVGLDAKTNHSDPDRYPAGHALNPRVNNLHWGWQGGYVFLALEGHYRRRDGRPGGFSYHLATDRSRMMVTLRGDIHITGNTQCRLDFDLASVFRGVSPAPENGADSSHSAPGDRLAVRLRTNVEHAFSLTSTRPAAASTPPGGAKERTVIPAGAHRYLFYVPQGFPQPDLPADNPLTVEGVALGKRLFGEKRLSGGGVQSCASCHRPESAFADVGNAHSLGVDGLPGARRTQPLFNLAWSGPYGWDGRQVRLRDQALAPMSNTREMHASLKDVVAELGSDLEYPALFKSAFGTPGVTAERVGMALEQYMLTLISADTRFDRALRGQEQLTETEKQGLMLFVTEYDPARGRIGADCFHCHGGNLFSDYRYTNNGLDDAFSDTGRALITGREADSGKFKTPSLRNVAVTGPYMHDGRFKTLEEVIDHYTRGIHRTATLDPNIAKHPDSGMALSPADKAALVAFLRTLTDRAYERRGSLPGLVRQPSASRG